MNPRSPQPPESPKSLDADERALARSLPRLHGRTTPGPDLDAHILATAQAAVRPAIRSRPNVRWIAPAALAASVMLAVGMAWQLRPLPSIEAPPSIARSGNDVAPARRAQSMPVVADESSPAPEQAMAAQPAESARPVGSAPVASPTEVAPADQHQAPRLPPAPPPSPAAPVPIAAPADAPQASGRAAKAVNSPAPLASRERMAAETSPALPTQARAADSARQPQPDSAQMQASGAQPRNEAEMAADAGFADDPGEDIPPATADAPAVRAAWLQRIDALLQQGRLDEAKASLAEFRRRYPQAELPRALQELANEDPPGRPPAPH